MKNFGKIKNFILKNYKSIFLISGLTLLNIFFLCYSFKSNQLKFGKTFICMLIGSILIEIILCSIIFIAKKHSWKIEKLFLVLGLIIGSLYSLAIPIGRATDEESHFFRIYELSKGHFVSDINDDGRIGSVEASNIEIIRDFKENNVTYAEIFENLNLYPDESDQTFVKTSAYSYSIVSYLPHVIGMKIGQILNLPVLVTAYIAKLFNCVACILLLYFSIKFIPFLKEIIFFIAFLPITMQGMTSLSADGFIVATSIALIGFVLYSTYTMKTTFSKKHYAMLLSLCLILSLSKIIYALICLFIFAIPKDRFKNQKTKFIAISSIGAICILILGFWFVASSTVTFTDAYNRNLILSNPFHYGAMLVYSLSYHFLLYVAGAFGGWLEWFNISLSWLYLFPSILIFAFLCKQARDTFCVNKAIRYLSIFIFTAVFISTFTAMFVSWTKPGANIIDGVQGRYFLPILLFIPLSFMSNSKLNHKSNSKLAKLAKLTQNYYLYSFIIFESVYAITTIACTHL